MIHLSGLDVVRAFEHDLHGSASSFILCHARWWTIFTFHPRMRYGVTIRSTIGNMLRSSGTAHSIWGMSHWWDWCTRSDRIYSNGTGSSLLSKMMIWKNQKGSLRNHRWDGRLSQKLLLVLSTSMLRCNSASWPSHAHLRQKSSRHYDKWWNFWSEEIVTESIDYLFPLS